MINILNILQTNDIDQLVNKILNIIMPIFMTVSIFIGTIYTAVTFIGGMGDITEIEKKQRIKRLIWIWICCGGVFLVSTIMLCLKKYFLQLTN